MGFRCFFFNIITSGCHDKKGRSLDQEKLFPYPMVVIKLVVNESSEKRSKRQLFPTPAQRQQMQIWKGCHAMPCHNHKNEN